MTHRTVIAGDVDSYLKFADPKEVDELNVRLDDLPYVIALEVSYPELDFANRWCWEQLGPADGECMDRHSEYRSCMIEEAHRHNGKWATHWHQKTDYNFGPNEWYFASEADRDRFIAFIASLEFRVG